MLKLRPTASAPAQADASVRGHRSLGSTLAPVVGQEVEITELPKTTTTSFHPAVPPCRDNGTAEDNEEGRRVDRRSESYGDEPMFFTNEGNKQGVLAKDHPIMAADLSYVGQAVRHALLRHHFTWRRIAWNITRGKIMGTVVQTPGGEGHHQDRGCWGCTEMPTGKTHSDFFPQRMRDVIARANFWVDITSLSPPDGKFAQAITESLGILAATARERRRKIIVRVLFGNIIGMPCDCERVATKLAAAMPDGCNMQLWVGAWRKGLTWNHSKIIAVDGQYLFQGGHNMWDDHYLKSEPVHDLSMEAEGPVAQDGHMFVDAMWKYVKVIDMSYCFRKLLPDWVPHIGEQGHVGISHRPRNAHKYPPMYHALHWAARAISLMKAFNPGEVPMITCGRYGGLHLVGATANPSDSAIMAMLTSARKTIRMSIQDLGPLTLPLPGMLRAIPGGRWPHSYLRALGLAICERNVTVQIALSNPHAVPGGLNPMLANYGNGWSCVDVAAEIIKAIKKNVPSLSESKLSRMVEANLRVTFTRFTRDRDAWPNGGSIGNHAKFFAIDDRAYYIGSQNLYIADLAEWGVIIDNQAKTQQVLDEYWDPLWEQSYRPGELDMEKIMASLGVDRDGCREEEAGLDERQLATQATRASFLHSDADDDSRSTLRRVSFEMDAIHCSRVVESGRCSERCMRACPVM